MKNLKSRYLSLVFVFLGFAVFGPFLGNPFLMDDEIQITGNSAIQDLGHWPDYFTGSTMSTGGGKALSGVYYKPVMTTYYAVMWHFFGNEPVAFRLPLLLMHIGSSIFLFLFFRFFFAVGPSLIAGLIFLVHPVNSEIIAYVADAQDALYLFFGMAALLAFQKFRRSVSLYVGVFLLLVLSLLSKETGALFLFIVPLYAALFAREKLIPSIAVSSVIAAIYLWVRSQIGLMQFEIPSLILHNASLAERLLTLPITMWHYIEILFVPWRISIITDFIIREATLLEFWLPLLGFVLFLLAIFWLWRILRVEKEKKIFLFFLGVLILWFGLHCNVIVPLDGAYADRWLYVACWAVLGLLILLIERKQLFGRKMLLVGLVVIFAFSARTWVRLEDWVDPLDLYRREYALNPKNAMMANNVGVEVFKRGDHAGAEIYFLKTTEINPHWDVGWSNYGAVQQRFGRTDQALKAYEKAVLMGTYYLAYENYGMLLAQLGRMSELRTFLKDRALIALPNNPKIKELARLAGL